MTKEGGISGPAALPARMALSRLLSGYRISQAIYVAGKLRIADLLADGPQSAAALAQATRTHPGSLRRLLRLLASAGVFAEREDGSFVLAPLGECLRTGGPGSLHPLAMFIAGPTSINRMWGDLLYSVETGKAAFDHMFGAGPFEYFAAHSEDAAIFHAAMASMTTQIAAAVPAVCDFSRFRTLVDVGGGIGVLLAAILRANPNLRGVLFDAPPVADAARKQIEAAGLAARCDAVGGNFFESVPAGADAYILKSVIHDWEDERSIAILKNCHRAMAPQGKLLLVELVLPERMEPTPEHQIAAEMDLTMLLGPGGCERSEREFRALFAAAGFRLTRIVPLEGSLPSLLEAERV